MLPEDNAKSKITQTGRILQPVLIYGRSQIIVESKKSKEQIPYYNTERLDESLGVGYLGKPVRKNWKRPM